MIKTFDTPLPRWVHDGRRIGGAVVLAGLLALTACGDDDTPASSAAAAAPSSSAAPSTSEPSVEATDTADCAPTSVELTNLATGVTTTATTAFAKRQADGALYVTYLADYDLGEDDLRSFMPDVPADGRVAIVQLTVFNAVSELEPLEVGTEVETLFGVDDVVTFVTQLVDGEERLSMSDGASTSGALTVDAVGEVFCAEVAFEDQDKRIVGTFAAPVIGDM